MITTHCSNKLTAGGFKAVTSIYIAFAPYTKQKPRKGKKVSWLKNRVTEKEKIPITALLNQSLVSNLQYALKSALLIFIFCRSSLLSFVPEAYRKDSMLAGIFFFFFKSHLLQNFGSSGKPSFLFCLQRFYQGSIFFSSYL